jgi:uncharacterized protein
VWAELLGALDHQQETEGAMPFLSPRRFRQSLLNFAAIEDRVMRAIGLACMIGGLLILNAVK